MSKRKYEQKNSWLEEADRFYNEEELEQEVYVPKLNAEEMMQLVHLNNLRKTTNCGAVDYAFPKMYASLAFLKFAKKVGDGYQITDEGRAYVDLHRRTLRTA